MCRLTVIRGVESSVVRFSPGARLSDVLAENGFAVAQPCGGRGICGKCRVEITGQISPECDAEKAAGGRLACRTVLLGDAEVILPEAATAAVETAAACPAEILEPSAGYGAATDIGTTTLALQLYSLETGALLAEETMLNPQASVAADVIGRIGAALDGQGGALRAQITEALDGMLAAGCRRAGVGKADVGASVVTGNTAMLYLYTGRDPDSLAHAPFIADTLFDVQRGGVYLPPCMNAFVGADTVCALLESGMCESGGTALLCDIGTNGEIALKKGGRLYVTSTAAGPAFEGVGISCGCGNIPGAIDRVYAVNGALGFGTIGGEKETGLCGSGLIDAVAAALQLGLIDETGAMEEEYIALGGVRLLQKDIRAFQLAKAAVAAGIQAVVKAAGSEISDIERLYIAGGFGSHLNAVNAAATGLLPCEICGKTTVLGNAALAGAARLLLNPALKERVRGYAKSAVHVDLGGNPEFNDLFIENMLFT